MLGEADAQRHLGGMMGTHPRGKERDAAFAVKPPTWYWGLGGIIE
jgi:hypothetical protein